MTGATIFALAAALASPKPGEVKTFSDWSVGCDNGRACQAVSLMEMETTDNQLTLVVRRGPGRTDTARISIANIENRVAGAPVSLAMEGGTVVATATIPAGGAPVEFALDKTVFDALRNARYAELRDKSGKSLGHASLKGMAAAILYMDDTQKRAKTVTALAAPGPAAATSVPAPPAYPRVTAIVPPKTKAEMLAVEDISKLRKMTGCDAELEDAGGPTEVVALSKDKALALLSCGAGAYNFSSVPILVSGKGKSRKFKPAPFDMNPETTEETGMPVLVNVGWDAKTGILSSYSKGRGLGDCGSSGSYIWDGKRFRLIEQKFMGECRGVIDWIPAWRAIIASKK
jgi:hypothetical protein